MTRAGMDRLGGAASGFLALGERAITCPLALWERVRVRAAVILLARLRHFLPVGLIDAAMAEAAFERLQVVGKLALDPFEIGQARAIGKLVEHPCGNQIGHVLLRYSLLHKQCS